MQKKISSKCPVCNSQGITPRGMVGYMCVRHPGVYGRWHYVASYVMGHKMTVGIVAAIIGGFFVFLNPATVGIAGFRMPETDKTVLSLMQYDSECVLPSVCSVAKPYVDPKTAKQYAKAVLSASSAYGLDPFVCMVLFKTESPFDKDAVSSKGYRGISQIPASEFTGDPVKDIMKGAKIFREKLDITNGNYINAICLYKGYVRVSKVGKVILYEKKGLDLGEKIVLEAKVIRKSIPQYDKNNERS